MSKTGAIVYGFHEGTRSEYFAQCVFSAFGTSIPVPHPEDHGIDFYCTLTERVGQRSWAKASYAVQVKSTPQWVIEGHESIECIIKHPLPLFFGVMDKKTLILRLYHTAPRFYVWATGKLPNRMEMIMTEDPVGSGIPWNVETKFNLAPILCIEMIKLAADDDYERNAYNVLKTWIEIENQNLIRIQTGMYGWEMPQTYETNVVPHSKNLPQFLPIHSEELLDKMIRHVCDALECLGNQFLDTDKFVAAVEAALLHRYLHRHCSMFGQDEKDCSGGLSSVFNRLNTTPLKKQKYYFSSVDELQLIVEKALEEN
jgi:hypothetical protein